MANTFTTNFNLTKPEVGGANDTWGELVNTNYTSIDTELFRKADKNDQKGVTHTLTFTSGSTNVTTNVTRGFASFNVDDKITISNLSSDADNKGEFKIEGITNDVTLDLKKTDDSEPTFSTETISSTVSIITEINKIEGSLDVSSDTLTTSTAQKDAIVDGSTAITRSTNDLTFAGNVDVTGDLTVTGNDIKSSGGTTVATFSGANTTLAGTANNIGTVTAGTIDHTVTMTGVPRRKKIKYLSGTSQSTTNNKICALGTISYPVVSGKTYLITANYGEFTQGGGSGSFGSAYYGIMYGTTNRSNGDTVTDTELIKREISYGTSDTRSQRISTLIGAYTSGSTTTHYAWVFRQGQNSSNTAVSDIYITVEEFDSDNLE